jgi:hypothetical protein
MSTSAAATLSKRWELFHAMPHLAFGTLHACVHMNWRVHGFHLSLQSMPRWASEVLEDTYFKHAMTVTSATAGGCMQEPNPITVCRDDNCKNQVQICDTSKADCQGHLTYSG